MTYELWSGPSANIVGAFETEHDALGALREVAERNGPEYVATLALMVEDDAGETTLLAEGRDLMRLVSDGSPAGR
jgi:hypothetical protein